MAVEMSAPVTTTASATDTGAPSHGTEDWFQIDWYRATKTVRRLQARIVKATQDGRWNRVRALQRLLTHSFSGKALAVRRVTENQGQRTPGVDGVTWDTPEKKATALHALRQRGYRPRPLRRVYIPKAGDRTRMRPLDIPVLADRAMQALYLLALDPIAETTADPNSYGFRKERSTADAIAQCHTVLARKGGARFVLEGDIRSCFNRISHAWLEAHIPMDKAILHTWLKAGFMDKHVLHPTEEGAPQGGVASPVLANLTLDGLERVLRDKYPKATALSGKAKVNLIRYADDFCVTGVSQDLLEHEVKPLIEHFLRERGLELSTEKTLITPIEEGFDFLGQTVRDYHGTILVTPSRKNVATFLTKVHALIKANAQATPGHLIVQLNPLMRGWATYHRHVSSKRTFVKVDHAIFQALWRWATRRHPKKPLRWVKDKYFHSDQGRNWVFQGEVVGRDGAAQTVRLFSAASLPIRRHRKITGAANPYDPRWEPYFEQRLGVAMESTLIGRRKLLHLWKEQDGLCPVCTAKITTLSGWHTHHIVWRSHGGSDHADNRVLLHPSCHQQVHSQRLCVVKPRPAPGV
jgi:RNA-directed DNA polymerase